MDESNEDEVRSELAEPWYDDAAMIADSQEEFEKALEQAAEAARRYRAVVSFEDEMNEYISGR